MSSPAPKTQYPGGEPTVFLGPDFRQVGIDGLISGASAIADLNARVTALENTMAPVNYTVPYVSQSGGGLNCTMGEWTGQPTNYAYQWQVDGSDVGAGAPDYTPSADEVGATATCTVTATNATGSGTAPPSNAVVISGAAP